MLKGLFGKKNEEVKVEVNPSRYDGKTYSGVWEVNGKRIIATYVRDGSNCFITDKGIYVAPKGSKKKQVYGVKTIDNKWFAITQRGLMELDVNIEKIDFFLHGLRKDYCLPLVSVDEL